MEVIEQIKWREKARIYAEEKHKTQTRRNGMPYFTGHLLPVALHIEQEFFALIPSDAQAIWSDYKDIIIAIGFLHDVIEDVEHTGVTMDELMLEFPVPMIYETVQILSKKKGESYFDFIMRIRDSGPFCIAAIAVKLADLWHNMSDSEEGSRLDKYRFAEYILKYLHKK